jgi:hypothetical protein
MRWLPDFVRVWLRLPPPPNCRKLPERVVVALLPDRWQLTQSLPVDIDVDVVVVIAVISPTGRGWSWRWCGREKRRRGLKRRLVENDGLRARLLAV